MSLSNNNNESGLGDWKTRNYINGTFIGLVIGLLGAYLFNRAAEENADLNGGKPAKVSTAQLIGISLTALGLLRQISEMGKPSKK